MRTRVLMLFLAVLVGIPSCRTSSQSPAPPGPGPRTGTDPPAPNQNPNPIPPNPPPPTPIPISVPPDDLTSANRNLPPKDRSGAGKRMELPSLAAGVDVPGQLSEEIFIELVPSKPLRETLGIDADERGSKSAGDHLHREIVRVPSPEWKDARQPGPLQKLLTIGANVIEKQVAEYDVRNSLLA